jgi:hypothetical protein
MKRSQFSLFAAGVVCFTFITPMRPQQSPAEGVADIQAALREAKLDGWLFYDFRHGDPLAYRILRFQLAPAANSRRC